MNLDILLLPNYAECAQMFSQLVSANVSSDGIKLTDSHSENYRKTTTDRETPITGYAFYLWGVMLKFPAWLMKAIVITAGVFMNLLLSLLIFWGVNFFQSKQITKTTTIGYVLPESAADSIGLNSGDKIIAVNGETVDNWEELTSELFINTLGQDLNIKVLRNEQSISLFVPRSMIPEETSERFLLPEGLSRPTINAVMENSPASKAGILAGDTFLKIDNVPVYTSYQTTNIIKSNKEKSIPVLLARDNDTLNLSVKPGADGIIGVSIGHNFTGRIDYESRGFFESFYYSWLDIIKMTNLTFSMFGKVIGGKVEFKKAFGGPIKIAQYAARSADTGILSFLCYGFFPNLTFYPQIIPLIKK